MSSNEINENEVEDELGFSGVKTSETNGFFILGSQVRLNLLIKEDNSLRVKLVFPSKELDLSETTARADIYSSAIESAIQIVDIINRMTGGAENENIS